jgi:fatty-acyl-CoA synthase
MRTFIDVLRDNAVHGDRSVTFVRSPSSERVVSYTELWLEARRRAHALLALGLQRGDRVALVLTEPDEFVLTFIGTLTAGLIAVPIFPPQTLAKMEAYGDTVRHVLAASSASVLITNDALRPLLEEHLVGSDTGLRLVLERDIRRAPAPLGQALSTLEPQAAPDADDGWEPPPVSLDDIAFLQFTSGSTSHPKGVMVTHRNLSVNSHAIMFDGLRSTPDDRGVSWLPLYHDMGLIGFVIAPLYALVQVMFLPTMAFIRRPSLWLDAVHRFRGTITFAPNFAYALATRAITESQAKSWDLSSMRALGCGAEPIQADVLRTFLSRFAAQGLKPESILPSYGMAEATLAITFSDVTAPLKSDRICFEAMRAGQAKPVSTGQALDLVSCGRPFPGHEIAIVGRDGRHLGEREVGEVWLKGPSVTAGYFRDPQATEETFGGGWLRTGDLGYVADGDLYICGRAKDLIILNGKNYYPQDVERVVSKVDGIRDGQCVAFSRLDETSGEIAVVVAEARKTTEGLAARVVSAARAELGLQIGEVHFIKRGSLPKTSSGKVRRRECKRRLEEGLLERIFEADEAENQPKRSFAEQAKGEEGAPSARTPLPSQGLSSFRKDTTQGATDGIQ